MRKFIEGTPRILIEYGKHGERFWFVPTLETLDAAALDLLRAKMDYDLTPLSDRDLEYMDEYRADADLTDKQIAALPGSFDIKAAAERKRKYAQTNLAWYEDRRAEYLRAEELAARTSTIAERPRTLSTGEMIQERFSETWRFLEQITDGEEYGRLELEYPKVVEPSTTTNSVNSVRV